MIKLAMLAVVVLIALMPPLFTGGACTAEFERASNRVEAERKLLATPENAAAYLRERGIPHSVVSWEQCRKARPRALLSCGDGTLLVAAIPVKNLVCNLYRDDTVRTYLQYDRRDRLERMQFDMNPYKSLPLPFGITLHWAR